MKIPMIFCNRETVALIFAFQAAFRHLYLGFKDLFICIFLAIILIPLTLLEWYQEQSCQSKKDDFYSR